MTKNQIVFVLGEIIRLTRQGKIESEISHCIGIKPSLVYRLCKLYGIKTKKPIKKEQKIEKPIMPQIQCFLPLQG